MRRAAKHNSPSATARVSTRPAGSLITIFIAPLVPTGRASPVTADQRASAPSSRNTSPRPTKPMRAIQTSARLETTLIIRPFLALKASGGGGAHGWGNLDRLVRND